MKKVKIIIPEKSMNYKLKKSNKFGYSFCVSMAAGLIMFGIFYSGAYILATSGPTTTIQNSENKLDIISISNIPEINIEYGVTPTLPATISVTLSNGIMANPAVLWDSTPEFNANIAGTYIFKGTPITTPLIINTKNLTAELNVIVAKQVIEETIEEVVVAESIPTIGELIQSSVVGFLDEMWKFSKWSFNYYLQGVVKIIPSDIKQATASLSSSVTNTFLIGSNQVRYQIQSGMEIISKLFTEKIQD